MWFQLPLPHNANKSLIMLTTASQHSQHAGQQICDAPACSPHTIQAHPQMQPKQSSRPHQS